VYSGKLNLFMFRRNAVQYVAYSLLGREYTGTLSPHKSGWQRRSIRDVNLLYCLLVVVKIIIAAVGQSRDW